MVAATDPLTVLPRVGPKTADTLARAGLVTVGDLLHHLPRAYQDRSVATPVASLVPGATAVVQGEVVAVRQGRRRGRTPGTLEARVDDGTGALSVVFFAPAPYIRKQWVKGARVLVMGRLEASLPLRLAHPEVELGPGGGASPHRDAIVPLYRTPDGMGQRRIRALVHAAFATAAELEGLIPPALRAELGLPTRVQALRTIHFPAPGDDVAALQSGTHAAHEALLLEDLFVLMVALLRRRARRAAAGSAADALPVARMGGARAMATLRHRAVTSLPFTLTGAQSRVLGEIDEDLARAGQPMQRLVQGDVGAGKTVLGLLAAAPILERGGQVAILAPTEVLAQQWRRRADALFGPLGIRTAWLAGGQTTAERETALTQLRTGRAQVAIGTHALVQDPVRFHRLALAIVDEQQRFGVFQRARLLDKGAQPHLLALTATPIPRSLARTLYGDLDLSTLDERPPRGPLTTELLPSARRRQAWTRARAVADAGERVFVVCPRIEGSGDGLRSVLQTAEELANGPLAGVPLGVLHGGMSSADKERALAAFRAGRIRVLVTTTVIEVGVHVAQATLMVVENAERFGLAQLHQLRGRVGRGARGGHCVLLTPAPDAAARLQVLATTDDGFAIAEADLRQRGPGDLVGARQAGTPAFRLTTSPRFLDLLRVAREAARDLVARPDFARDPSRAPLRAAARARVDASLAVDA